MTRIVRALLAGVVSHVVSLKSETASASAALTLVACAESGRCLCTGQDRVRCMRVLCLSPYPERLAAVFEAVGDTMSATKAPVVAEQMAGVDWLVSYGYRHILKRPILDFFPRRAINLHLAFLPYNRGAHPNYWAWAEGTPSGVTIHEIDDGIDTGPVIAQRMLVLLREKTFRETYVELQAEIEEMFSRSWPVIRTGRFTSLPQIGPGTSIVSAICRSGREDGMRGFAIASAKAPGGKNRMNELGQEQSSSLPRSRGSLLGKNRPHDPGAVTHG